MTPLVTRQSYMALNVEDLDASVRDAEDVLGLRVVDRHDGKAILTATGRRAELMLHQAPANAARAVGLEAHDADAVEAAASRAAAAGLTVLSRTPSLACIEHSVTFATSDGQVFEVHTPMPADQPRRYAGAGIHPRGICHVNLTSPDPWRIYGELHEAIGLKLSERTTGCELVWMRAADGRHHTVGCVKGPRPGIHHYAWEFAQFSDFMRLGDVLDALDRVIAWGPGRHGAGDAHQGQHQDRRSPAQRGDGAHKGGEGQQHRFAGQHQEAAVHPVRQHPADRPEQQPRRQRGYGQSPQPGGAVGLFPQKPAQRDALHPLARHGDGGGRHIGAVAPVAGDFSKRRPARELLGRCRSDHPATGSASALRQLSRPR